MSASQVCNQRLDGQWRQNRKSNHIFCFLSCFYLFFLSLVFCFLFPLCDYYYSVYCIPGVVHSKKQESVCLFVLFLPLTLKPFVDWLRQVSAKINAKRTLLRTMFFFINVYLSNSEGYQEQTWVPYNSFSIKLINSNL